MDIFHYYGSKLSLKLKNLSILRHEKVHKKYVNDLGMFIAMIKEPLLTLHIPSPFILSSRHSQFTGLLMF